MIIPIIIGGSLAAAGIITLIIGCKKIKINTQIKLDNQRLEEENIVLVEDNLALERERERAFYKLEEVKAVLSTFQQQLEKAKEDFSKNYENYVEVYEGDSARRDFSYHQGITWTWLLGLYYNSLKKLVECSKIKTEKAKYELQLKEFIKEVTQTFSKEIFERGCIGSIAEIYDSRKPHTPKGTFAQAWSVAEVFRIILER